ncbi:MAG: hypothetical protein AB7P02_17265 [Alphaproteobacteria bacterium]
MGKSSGSTTTVNKMPEWVEKGGENLWNAASDLVANNPRGIYTGQRVAEFAPATMKAFDAINDNSTPIPRGAAYQTAQATTQGLQGFTPTTVSARQVGTPQTVTAERYAPGNLDMSGLTTEGRTMTAPADVATTLWSPEVAARYMNPYLSNVVEQTQADMARQAQVERNMIGDAAHKAGAFGGSRHGVVEAEFNRDYVDRMGKNVGDLLYQGYGQAAGIFGQDMARKLQADQGNQNIQFQTGKANLDSLSANDRANQDVLARGRLTEYTTKATAGMADADRQLAASRANQDADLRARMADQSATLSADQGNQRAGIDAAGVKLGAAKASEEMGFRNLVNTQDERRKSAQELLQAGILQTGQRQQILDNASDDFYRAQAMPYDDANFLRGILAGTPYTTSQTQQQPKQSPFMSILGLGLSGLGAAGGLGWKPFA